ncbi:MAG: CoA-binding protein [Saprospiraceae bacterium]
MTSTVTNHKTTVVLGASPNPGRYSYEAVHRLHAKGIRVVPVGIRQGEIDGIDIKIGQPAEEEVDTVTLYLNAKRQKEYYDYILELNPRRIIFNPGTENAELMNLARERGIEPVIACTLVMLSTGEY